MCGTEKFQVWSKRLIVKVVTVMRWYVCKVR